MRTSDYLRNYPDRIHYAVATTTALAALPAEELLAGRLYPVTEGPEFYGYTATTFTASDGVVPATNGGTFIRVGSASGGAPAAAHVVRLASQAALAANTRTGNVIVENAPGAALVIDAVNCAADDRVLLRNEGGGASHINNGIWIVDAIGGGGAKFQLTRAQDFNDTSEIQPACLVAVAEGGVGADGIYILNTNAPITVNASVLQFSPAGVLALGATGGMAAELVNSVNAAGVAVTGAPIDHVHRMPIGMKTATITSADLTAANVGPETEVIGTVLPVGAIPFAYSADLVDAFDNGAGVSLAMEIGVDGAHDGFETGFNCFTGSPLEGVGPHAVAKGTALHIPPPVASSRQCTATFTAGGDTLADFNNGSVTIRIYYIEQP